MAPSIAARALADTPTYTRWILAEGAANDFFTEDILIGNPNAAAVTIRITLLPQNDSGQPGTAIVIPNFDIAATSRYTFHVNAVQNLTAGSVSAVVECVSCTTSQGIVVERSMYWSDTRKRGGHNSQGVLAPATSWYLAEGTTGMFDTFILIANPDTTQSANVEVTYLREASGPLVQTFTMGPNTRKTIYVNQGVDVAGSKVFINEPFSTAIRSTNGTGLVVERSMYWNGFEGGHEATGVPSASTTWLFAEGATGGSPAFIWDTYLLLANPQSTDANVTFTFFRDAGGPLTCTGKVPANHRKTIHANDLGDPTVALTCDGPASNLASAAFATKIVSDQPIVAERAMYWTTTGVIWIDGHDTPGVTEEAAKWAFAEGTEGRIDDTGIWYDSYFLFSNSGTSPLPLKATFMREDGTGVVKNYTIAPQSRFTLLAGDVIEMSNQKFSAFFESTNGATFVAERAVYWGDGYYGGHGSTGTPWTGTIGAPAAANLGPVVTSIAPNHGVLAGGTQVTIQGANFSSSATVQFGSIAAASVYVANANRIVAVTPPGTAAGAVNVTVSNPGFPVTTVGNGFTYDQPTPTGPTTTVDVSLAFGDSITFGTITTLFTDPSSGITSLKGGSTTPYSERLRVMMSDRYRNQNIIIQNAGVPGECVTRPCVPQTYGVTRLPGTITSSQDLVIILEGVNDLNGSVNADDIINGLRSMIQSARARGKAVILCGLTPVKSHDQSPSEDPVFWKTNPYRVADLNGRIEGLKTELQVPRVNMFSAFGAGDYTTPLACSQNAACRALIGPDGLHPNDAGYQRMAEAIFEKIMADFEVH